MVNSLLTYQLFFGVREAALSASSGKRLLSTTRESEINSGFKT